jgi:hypothetical protein
MFIHMVKHTRLHTSLFSFRMGKSEGARGIEVNTHRAEQFAIPG